MNPLAPPELSFLSGRLNSDYDEKTVIDFSNGINSTHGTLCLEAQKNMNDDDSNHDARSKGY